MKTDAIINSVSFQFALSRFLPHRAARFAAMELAVHYHLPFNGSDELKHKEHVAKYGRAGSPLAQAAITALKARLPASVEDAVTMLKTALDAKIA